MSPDGSSRFIVMIRHDEGETPLPQQQEPELERRGVPPDTAAVFVGGIPPYIHCVRRPKVTPCSWSPQTLAFAGPEIVNKWQNPQDTCSNIPGRVLPEVAEALQAAATQTHRAGGP